MTRSSIQDTAGQGAPAAPRGGGIAAHLATRAPGILGAPSAPGAPGDPGAPPGSMAASARKAPPVAAGPAREGAAASGDPLQNVHYRPELPGDDGAIDAMHAETFGPGRFARTAFRLREGVTHDIGVSLVAEHDGALVGSVRLTPIRIGDAPALLLGPLTVRPHLKNRGVGKALMRMAVERARDAGHRLVLLVGDLPYYEPFGFRVSPPGKITMPGPVDPARLLIAELVPGAGEAARGRAVGG